MPPDRLSPDDPHEWLARARSSLAQARVQAPSIYLEDLCFNAQQAAEKALKGLLLHRGVQFPRVHDIGALLDLLRQAGERIPGGVDAARGLTDYAVEARYPGLAEPVTPEEHAGAIALADEVLRWVEDRLS